MKVNKTIIWFSRWFYFLLAHLPSKILANAILFTAIFSLMIQGGLYYAEKHPHKVQQFLAEFLLIEASFSSVKSEFNLLYPSLELKNLTIYAPHTKAPWLSFKSAAISVDLLKSLVSLQPKLNYFHLDGLRTSLSRDSQGTIYLGDIVIKNSTEKKSSPQSPATYLWLLSQKFISLSNSHIVLNDAIRGIKDFTLSNINIALKNSWWHHQLSVAFSNQEGREEFDEIKLIMDFKGSIYKIYEWQGDFYLGLDGLEFSNEDDRFAYQLYKEFLTQQQYSLHYAQLDSQIWGKIENGQLKSVSGLVEHGQVTLFDSIAKRYIEISNFFSDFTLQNSASIVQRPASESQNNSWHFLLDDLEFDIAQQMVSIENIRVDIKLPSKGEQNNKSEFIVRGFTPRLQLKQLSPVLEQFLPSQQQALQALAFSGVLKNVSADFIIRDKALTDLKLYGQLDNYRQAAWKEFPHISQLSAEYWLNLYFRQGQASSDGIVNINSPDLRLKLPNVFRDSWQFDTANAQISWQKIGELTWIDSGVIELSNQHLSINGNTQFWLDGKNSPLMLIDANYNKVNAAYTSLYLPVSLLDKELVTWLDEGIMSGRVPDGGVLFRGRLDDFPYTDFSGNMDIVFNSKNLKLNYQNGWPILTDLDARTTFTEQGMWIEGWYAKTLNATSYNTRVALNDYMTGILEINSLVKGTAKDGLSYLLQSDVLSESHVNSLASRGNIDINLNLVIPTDGPDDEIQSLINIALKNVAYVPEWLAPTQITDINGELKVENGFINAKNIQGQLNGETVTININTEPETEDLDAITQLEVDTKVSTQTMLGSGFIPGWLEPLFPKLSGFTPIHINLLIPNNEEIFPQVVVLSDLKGVKSDLPKPFNKKAKDKLPFQLSYSEDERNSQFRVKLGETINVISELKDDQFGKKQLDKLGLSFGAKAALLPRRPGIIVHGNLDLSDLEKWLALNTDLSDLKTNKPQAVIDFRLPIKFSFDRVNLPLWNSDENTTTATTKVQDKKTPKVVNLPTINGYISHLTVADKELGSFRISSSQNKQEYNIKKLQLKGEWVDFNLQGKWDKSNKKPLTRLDGNLDIEDVGKLTAIVGYDSVTKQAKMNFNGYAKWHGSPIAFDYKKLFGVIKLTTGAGYFSNIDPGVGRVLGLFNLNKITKRITLDFSDVSSNGFSFENINGDFLFNEGNLYTRDLTVNSSMALITVDGLLDLEQQKFDELVTIVPNISSGLTLAGAALAGPVGAAAGWIGHALVGKQVNKISQYQHKITGTWDEPIISPVGQSFKKVESNLE